MRALLLTLLLTTVSAKLGEWDCIGCTTLIDRTCLPFDIGEDCIPDNYKELVRDLKLYREFFYLEETVIDSFRCLDYGISVRHFPGTTFSSNITKEYFQSHYKGYFTRDCENWSFAPNNNIYIQQTVYNKT